MLLIVSIVTCYSQKCHWYGISGKGYNLIQSYLENRYQRVIISNKSWQYYSEWELTQIYHGKNTSMT
jgi:hypothetical protein